MEFKNARQRRRYHTRRKTLARYKRQLNDADHKSIWASFCENHDAYPLEHFDERAWYRTMRRDGTAGKLRGNHHGKHSDPYGELFMQTTNRARRNRSAMRDATRGYEPDGEPLPPGARPRSRSERAPNDTQLRDKILALQEENHDLRARRYRDGPLGEFLSDFNGRRIRTLETRIHALEAKREARRAARAARREPRSAWSEWITRAMREDARAEALYLTLDDPTDTCGLDARDRVLLERFVKEALHSRSAREAMQDTHARPQIGDIHYDHITAALDPSAATREQPTPGWAAVA